MKSKQLFSNYNILILIFLMLFSTMGVNNTTIVTGQGTVSTDIQPGNTIWYNIDEASNLNSLFPSSNFTFKDTLVDSKIFVKIMNVGDENLTYWDGVNYINGSIPVVDLSTGLILNQNMTVDTIINGTTQTVVLPEGGAVPFPLIFGSATQFNVTNFENTLFPAPLVLNDNYVLHETVINQLTENIPQLSVTNTATQFRIDFDFLQSIGPITISLQAYTIWRKSDGLLTDLYVAANNSTDTIKLKISISSIENKALSVKVGDVLDLYLNEFELEYTLSGFDVKEAEQLDTQIFLLKSVINTVMGKNILKFEVVEVRGLYYKVEGSFWNPQTGIYQSLNNLTGLNGIWMNGFGSVQYQIPRILAALGSNYTTQNKLNDSNWSIDMIRLQSIPGLVITPDWQIYQAFDKTLAVLSNIDTSFLNQTSSNPLDVQILSILDDIKYSVLSSTTWDLTVNGTQTSGSSETTIEYDLSGEFQSFELDASGFVNDNGNIITISKLRIFLSNTPVGTTKEVVSTSSTTITTSAQTTQSSTSESTNQDSPGFVLFVTVFSLLLVSVKLKSIDRSRKYR